MTDQHITCGKFGEDTAKNYLSKNGYAILETNYRCREGEIDIIARDGDCLVFVEVKTRKNADYGAPCEAVGLAKQRKIIMAAQNYMADNNIDCAVRLDVIEVFYQKRAGTYRTLRLNHIKNAFMEV